VSGLLHALAEYYPVATVAFLAGFLLAAVFASNDDRPRHP